MRLALGEAEKAAQAEEVPTGCVIFSMTIVPGLLRGVVSSQAPRNDDAPRNDGNMKEASREPTLIATAHNQTETLKDPTAHAEMLAIRQAAAALGDWRLENTVLFVTKEPCPMCAGAMVLARIPVVVYGFSDPKRGGISVFNILRHDGLNHTATIIPDILHDECLALFQSFFRNRR